MEVRDSIYGRMQFTDSEARLISSRSFDRLRRVKQLSFSEYVYPGATHNRYTHSLGVCCAITEMYDRINAESPGFFKDGDLELLRMMGLAHDLGHSPFSHSSETLSPISHEDRMVDILEYEKSNVILANRYGLAGHDLVSQVYNAEGMAYLTDRHLITLHGFMDGFIDADKIDYLARDARNCGVFYGNFDRHGLIGNLVLFTDSDGVGHLAVDAGGLQALEGFVLARYYMYSQVYFHPLRRLLDILFNEAMGGILPGGKYPSDVRKFLQWDDSRVAPKLKFLTAVPYELVYDSNFSLDVKKRVDRTLGQYLLCDTPRKGLFRRDETDSTVFIRDSLDGKFVPCADVSAVLRGIQFEHIHKLRYYAPKEIAAEIKQEIVKVLKGGVV